MPAPGQLTVRAVLYAAVLCALCTPRLASAHGDPAAVLGAVRADEGGRPDVLRLTEGLARREGERFRYLCPALFESDQAPRAVALADGTVIAATLDALFVLDDAGGLRAHAGVEAGAGTITALDANADAAFVLRARAGQSELLRVDAASAEVIATLPAEHGSLAVEGDSILVAGLTADGRVSQRGLDVLGEPITGLAAEAAAPSDAAAALARFAGGRAYVVVVRGATLAMDLVRLSSRTEYRVVHAAPSAISGPITAGDGSVLLASGGTLSELRDDVVTPRSGDAAVTCVSRAGAFGYACTAGGLTLATLDAGGLGAEVFDLEQLEPPELAGLAPAVADRCSLQWLRFAVDLIGAGLRVPALDAGPSGSDAGPDAAAHEAGGERDGGARPARNRGGCSIAAPGSPTGGALGLITCVLAYAACRRPSWQRSRATRCGSSARS